MLLLLFVLLLLLLRHYYIVSIIIIIIKAPTSPHQGTHEEPGQALEVTAALGIEGAKWVFEKLRRFRGLGSLDRGLGV